MCIFSCFCAFVDFVVGVHSDEKKKRDPPGKRVRVNQACLRRGASATSSPVTPTRVEPSRDRSPVCLRNAAADLLGGGVWRVLVGGVCEGVGGCGRWGGGVGGGQVLKDNLKEGRELRVYFCMFHQITRLYLPSAKNTLPPQPHLHPHPYPPPLALLSFCLKYLPDINPSDSSVPKEMTRI